MFILILHFLIFAGAAHGICMFYKQPGGMPAICVEGRKIELTNTSKEHILSVINGFRTKLAKGEETGKDGEPLPKAYGMRQMYWNDQLASLAEVSAKDCKSRPDLCKTTDVFPNPDQCTVTVQLTEAGQFLIDNNQTTTVNNLTEEKVNYAIDSALNQLYQNKDWVTRTVIDKHYGSNPYSTMIYGWSTHVGCGINVFFNNNHGQEINDAMLVCNFSHRPTEGQKVYETEPPHKERVKLGWSEKCGCEPGLVESQDCLCIGNVPGCLMGWSCYIDQQNKTAVSKTNISINIVPTAKVQAADENMISSTNEISDALHSTATSISKMSVDRPTTNATTSDNITNNTSDMSNAKQSSNARSETPSETTFNLITMYSTSKTDSTTPTQQPKSYIFNDSKIANGSVIDLNTDSTTPTHQPKSYTVTDSNIATDSIIDFDINITASTINDTTELVPQITSPKPAFTNASINIINITRYYNTSKLPSNFTSIWSNINKTIDSVTSITAIITSTSAKVASNINTTLSNAVNQINYKNKSTSFANVTNTISKLHNYLFTVPITNTSSNLTADSNIKSKTNVNTETIVDAFADSTIFSSIEIITNTTPVESITNMTFESNNAEQRADIMTKIQSQKDKDYLNLDTTIEPTIYETSELYSYINKKKSERISTETVNSITGGNKTNTNTPKTNTITPAIDTNLKPNSSSKANIKYISTLGNINTTKIFNKTTISSAHDNKINSNINIMPSFDTDFEPVSNSEGNIKHVSSFKNTDITEIFNNITFSSARPMKEAKEAFNNKELDKEVITQIDNASNANDFSNINLTNKITTNNLTTVKFIDTPTANQNDTKLIVNDRKLSFHLRSSSIGNLVNTNSSQLTSNTSNIKIITAKMLFFNFSTKEPHSVFIKGITSLPTSMFNIYSNTIMPKLSHPRRQLSINLTSTLKPALVQRLISDPNAAVMKMLSQSLIPPLRPLAALSDELPHQLRMGPYVPPTSNRITTNNKNINRKVNNHPRSCDDTCISLWLAMDKTLTLERKIKNNDIKNLRIPIVNADSSYGLKIESKLNSFSDRNQLRKVLSPRNTVGQSGKRNFQPDLKKTFKNNVGLYRKINKENVTFKKNLQIQYNTGSIFSHNIQTRRQHNNIERKQSTQKNTETKNKIYKPTRIVNQVINTQSSRFLATNTKPPTKSSKNKLKITILKPPIKKKIKTTKNVTNKIIKSDFINKTGPLNTPATNTKPSRKLGSSRNRTQVKTETNKQSTLKSYTKQIKKLATSNKPSKNTKKYITSPTVTKTQTKVAIRSVIKQNEKVVTHVKPPKNFFSGIKSTKLLTSENNKRKSTPARMITISPITTSIQTGLSADSRKMNGVQEQCSPNDPSCLPLNLDIPLLPLLREASRREQYELEQSILNQHNIEHNFDSKQILSSDDETILNEILQGELSKYKEYDNINENYSNAFELSKRHLRGNDEINKNTELTLNKNAISEDNLRILNPYTIRPRYFETKKVSSEAKPNLNQKDLSKELDRHESSLNYIELFNYNARKDDKAPYAVINKNTVPKNEIAVDNSQIYKGFNVMQILDVINGTSSPVSTENRKTDLMKSPDYDLSEAENIKLPDLQSQNGTPEILLARKVLPKETTEEDYVPLDDNLLAQIFENVVEGYKTDYDSNLLQNSVSSNLGEDINIQRTAQSTESYNYSLKPDLAFINLQDAASLESENNLIPEREISVPSVTKESIFQRIPRLALPIPKSNNDIVMSKVSSTIKEHSNVHELLEHSAKNEIQRGSAIYENQIPDVKKLEPDYHYDRYKQIYYNDISNILDDKQTQLFGPASDTTITAGLDKSNQNEALVTQQNAPHSVSSNIVPLSLRRDSFFRKVPRFKLATPVAIKKDATTKQTFDIIQLVDSTELKSSDVMSNQLSYFDTDLNNKKKAIQHGRNSDRQRKNPDIQSDSIRENNKIKDRKNEHIETLMNAIEPKPKISAFEYISKKDRNSSTKRMSFISSSVEDNDTKFRKLLDQIEKENIDKNLNEVEEPKERKIYGYIFRT